MMEQFDSIACETARQLTLAYSTSFGSATRLFPKSIRTDIFNIYGLVRIADEIVDTYRGPDAARLLDAYEQAAYDAITAGFSTDLILHAFQLTARRFSIGHDLIKPFFESMRMDIHPPKRMSQKQYETYIYGSAEVVGLMCLKVFTHGGRHEYDELAPGAQALGSAFQKINFLRDLASDTWVLKRHYFPDVDEGFGEDQKVAIIADIYNDLAKAHPAIRKLPREARPSVTVAYKYYTKLLNKLSNTPAHRIMSHRVRLHNAHKAIILGPAYLRARIRR